MQNAVDKWNNIPLFTDDRFDTYFHTLSHDLRTPMNCINGFAELLNLDDSLSVANREYTAAIMSACDELTIAVQAHLHLVENGPRSTGQSRAVESPFPSINSLKVVGGAGRIASGRSFKVCQGGEYAT